MAIAAPFPAARPAPRQARQQPTARSTSSSISGLRLTRRGRIVLMFASSMFLLIAVIASGRFSADAGTSLADQGRATGVVVVQPGESLWQIAEAIAPGVDPRETISLIRNLNGLGDTTVVAGQSIVVPAFR
jgi:nucleoid-associated protein YgaU